MSLIASHIGENRIIMNNSIIVRGARENNLKNIDVEIPTNQLVVITGVSGSGKSSFAFDTIFVEGQRRYMTSLASHAKQGLYQVKKPDVDQIIGLPPTLSIEQKDPAGEKQAEKLLQKEHLKKYAGAKSHTRVYICPNFIWISEMR